METTPPLLEEREVRNLVAATGLDASAVHAVLEAAAKTGVAFLLPPLRAAGHYPEWSAFTLGENKSAHLRVDDADHSLCGVGVLSSAQLDVPRGTQLCIGCAYHARILAGKPFDRRSVIGRACRVGKPVAASATPSVVPAASWGRIAAPTPAAPAPSPPAPKPTVASVSPASAPPAPRTATEIRPTAPKTVTASAPVADESPSLFDLAV